ncbi:MAG: linear amide C-N hydrolase [Candidatus Bathyarchaeota archaeon]|nr:MAG: linear amide C-N hydrolase [Candidatus Bathyarchaeota archaeon]
MSPVGSGAKQTDVADTGSLSPSKLEKVDDYPLYVLRLEGDYGFSEYLRTGRLNYRFSDGSGHSCTCFTAMGEGSDPLFGRNFDFPENPALLLYTDPPDGYASVSMVDLGYFGYGMGRLPDLEGDLKDLRMTPYLPFDGMNEHGLAVGMAAISQAEPPHDPSKGTIGEIQVIRLLLDRARDVDGALALLGEYNVEMTEPPIHYIVADRSGRSAIVEYVDGEMVVLRDDDPYQVITNFIVYDSGAPGLAPCSRYRSAYSGLREVGGTVSMEEAMDLLEGSSQESTIWSTVYNLETGDLNVAMGGRYKRVHSFNATVAED